MAFPGEALSAAVACRLLNAQGYRSVEVWDAHSDVSLALLDRVRHRPASDFAAPIVTAQDVVVAPDLGAVKRATGCARLAGAPLVHAEKTRSTDTGAITGHGRAQRADRRARLPDRRRHLRRRPHLHRAWPRCCVR